MKLLRIFFLGLAGFSIINSAHAMKSCPFPMGMQASIGIAKEAVSAKSQGLKKEDLIAKAPTENSSNAWLVSLMREIINEVYDFSDIPPSIYTTYRGEICYQSINKPDAEITINYTQAHPLLQSCISESNESEQRKCAMRVVDDFVGASK
jgi:hypothetical protein